LHANRLAQGDFERAWVDFSEQRAGFDLLTLFKQHLDQLALNATAHRDGVKRGDGS